MRITNVRNAAREFLSEFGEVQVWVAPTDMSKVNGNEPIEEIKLAAKIMVGPANEEGCEELVDELLENVPAKFVTDTTLGGKVEDAAVLSSTGHRMYSAGPNEPTLMGTEFTLGIAI